MTGTKKNESFGKNGVVPLVVKDSTVQLFCFFLTGKSNIGIFILILWRERHQGLCIIDSRWRDSRVCVL